jgi:hypothetical protein
MPIEDRYLGHGSLKIEECLAAAASFLRFPATSAEGRMGPGRGEGMLRRQGGEEVRVGYRVFDIGFGGQPSCFELLDLSITLQEGEIVTLIDDEGRHHVCQLLSSSSTLCAVIHTLDAP